MDLEISAAELAFRDEVRAFIDANLTPELRAAGERLTSVRAPTSRRRASRVRTSRRSAPRRAWSPCRVT